MKFLPALFLSFLLLGTTCNREEQEAAYLRMVKQADKISLFLLDPFPTEPAEQVTGEQYLADYRVQEEINMSREEAAELRRAMRDPDQFLSKNRKSCPFMARHGIRLERKKAWMEVVVSRSSCPKAIVRSSYTDELSQRDLTAEGLIAYLGSYAKGF